MGAGDSQEILMPLSFSENEWHMLRSVRPNILVIGGADFVASTVSTLVAMLPGPVSYLPPNAPPPAGDDDAEMLVVPDISYPLVKSDQFSGVLYYRLNTILLDMQTADESPARKSRER